MSGAVLTLCACEAKRPTEPVVEAPPEKVGWVYSERADAMRGTTTHQACVTAKPNADQTPAAGDLNAAICVQDVPGTQDTRLFLRISGDTLKCRSRNDCDVPWKADSSPVTTVFGSPRDDDSGAELFATSTISEVYSSERIMVELPLQRSGPIQFTFETAGLRFPPSRT